MQTLLDVIEEQQFSGTAVVNADGSQLLWEDISAAVKQCRASLSGTEPLALHFTTLTEFIIHIIAVDGWRQKVYLQPTDEVPVSEPVIHGPPFAPGPHSMTPQSSPTHWHLATSGTTGTPKWIAHTTSALSSAVKTGHRQQQLRWGLCYHPARFAGLQVVLQSLLSGATLIDCSGQTTEDKVQMQLAHNVNAVSATPSLWRQLLLCDNALQLDLANITLGGEIADAPLLHSLKKAFPSARVLHIYASTEAGVGFAVSDGAAGFPKAWLKTGIGNSRIHIDDNNKLWLKTVNAGSNALAVKYDSQGFVDTGDLVSVVSDRVMFKGRENGAINVGGAKVHPEHVEQILLQCHDVVAVKVYGKHSSLLGQLVAADVVVKNDDVPASKRKMQLLLHAKAHLQRHEIPAQIQFVDNINISQAGKVNRKEHE